MEKYINRQFLLKIRIMKRLYLIFLLAPLSVFAQNSGFPFGTMWYLEKIEENNVVYNIPPFNGFEYWRIQIAHNNINGVPTDDFLTAEYCVGFTGPVTVEKDHFSFVDEQFAYTLNMCGWVTPDDLEMMNRHMAFYQDYLSYEFYYDIQFSTTEQKLIVTNNVGNKAYYSTIPLLSTPSLEKLENEVVVFPNPFEERFFVEDSEQIIEEIKIFDNTGRLIKVITNQTPLQEIYTDFSSGIYYINIKAKDGRVMNKKIIKK